MFSKLYWKEEEEDKDKEPALLPYGNGKSRNKEIMKHAYYRSPILAQLSQCFVSFTTELSMATNNFNFSYYI